MNYLLVAFGGALGSVFRYAVSHLFSFMPKAATFPWATLTVNIIGGFLIGVCINLIPRDHQLWYLVVTGLIGGFTTFSAFSLETVALFKAQHVGLACLYVALSVVLSLAAVVLGMQVKTHG